jgi:hypothetical protein
MRMLVKRIVLALYEFRLLAVRSTQWLIDRLNLSGE